MRQIRSPSHARRIKGQRRKQSLHVVVVPLPPTPGRGSTLAAKRKVQDRHPDQGNVVAILYWGFSNVHIISTYRIFLVSGPRCIENKFAL